MCLSDQVPYKVNRFLTDIRGRKKFGWLEIGAPIGLKISDLEVAWGQPSALSMSAVPMNKNNQIFGIFKPNKPLVYAIEAVFYQ